MIKAIKLSVSVSLLSTISLVSYAETFSSPYRLNQDFTSAPTSCGKVVEGKTGAIIRGAKNTYKLGLPSAVVRDVNTAKIEPVGYKVLIEEIRRGGDGNVFRILSTDGKVGLWSPCTGVLVNPQFLAITPFSDDELAIGITDSEYTIIDKKGIEVTSQRFRHGLDFSEFEPGFEKGFVYGLWSYKRRIPASQDGQKWGLYNLNSQSFIISPLYDEIETLDRRGPNGPRLIVTQNGMQSEINNLDGELVAPLVFENYERSELLNGSQYVFGRDTQGGANAYSVAAREYVLPTHKSYTLLEPEYDSAGRHSARWIVHKDIDVYDNGRKLGNGTTLALYDYSQKDFLIDFMDRPTGSLSKIGDTELYVATSRSIDSQSAGAVFNAKTGEQITEYHEGVTSAKQLSINTQDSTGRLTLAFSNSNYFWAYDDNNRLIHKGIANGKSWAEVKNNLYVLTERQSRRTTQKSYTCIDQNFQIIGLPGDCIPRQAKQRPQSINTGSEMSIGDSLSSLSCDHKMFKRKPNVAADAIIEVSSTFCGNGACYDKENMIDGDRSETLGPRHSWTNSGNSEKWVTFLWDKPVQNMEQVYFIGTEDYEVGSYKIDVRTQFGWKNVATVNGNNENKICHRFPPEDIDAVRIEGKGPPKQPVYFRLNEVVIR